MKTFLFAAALALTTFTASANKTTSTNKTFGYRFTNTLQTEFGDVENLSWSTASNNMYKAAFTKNNEKVNAFFNENGEIIATTVELAIDDLPKKVKNAVYQQEKDGVITEAIHLTNSDEVAYFVKVYVNGAEKVYKSNSLGQLSETKF